MPRTRSRGDLRTQAREEADMESDDFVTNSMANRWIDQSLARLWGKLVAADSVRYSTTSDVTTTTGTSDYALPTDFMAIVAVWQMVGTERFPVDPFQEFERFSGPPGPYTWHGRATTRYRIVGQGIDGTAGRIQFDPDPGSQTFELRYVQAAPTLDADEDLFDGVNGWEDWIVYDVAIRMKTREDTDATALKQERALIESEIQTMAAKRDAGRPGRVQDVDHGWTVTI